MPDNGRSGQERAGTPGYVAGIYNYCDRWCRRCPMTARCAVFAMEQADARVPDPQARTALCEQLAETFENAMALLRELAEEAGIDLDAATGDAPGPDAAQDHILVLSALKYEDGVRRWFSGRCFLLDEPLRSCPVQVPVRPVPVGSEALDDRAGDLLDTVLRYRTLIYSKIYRAVTADAVAGPERPQGLPRDADGSAKVALIAMDRSMEAWLGLIRRFPGAGTQIHDLVRKLERLRRTAEWAFPRARAFVRPGFDDT